eukprot:gene15335-9194_t
MLSMKKQGGATPLHIAAVRGCRAPPARSAPRAGSIGEAAVYQL